MSTHGTYKISGIPVPASPMTTGNVFFVDSGNVDGDDSPNSGKKPNVPFVTLDYAVSQCTANNGDVIYVMPGHAENLSAADAIDLDVAGISVIGIGVGTDRPTFTYTNAAGEVVIGADNVLIENMVFNASVTAVLKGIDIEDGVDYATIRNCKFGVDAANTDEFNATITLVNNNTGCLIEGCEIDMGLGGAVSGIDMTADTERTTIRNNYIHGDYSTACINGDTTLSTDVLIEGNKLVNGGSGNVGTVACIVLLTGTTGLIQNNTLVCNLADPAAAISSDTTIEFNNKYSETADDAGMPIPSTSYNPRLGYKVTKADANLPQSTTETAFTVAGGRVLVTRMTAEIGTVVQTQLCNMKVTINPTTGTSADIATNLDITASESGSIGLVEGDGTAFVMVDAGTVWGDLIPFEVNIGTIDVTTSASNTGTIKWELWYFPLEAGATVS